MHKISKTKPNLTETKFIMKKIIGQKRKDIMVF